MKTFLISSCPKFSSPSKSRAFYDSIRQQTNLWLRALNTSNRDASGFVGELCFFCGSRGENINVYLTLPDRFVSNDAVEVMSGCLMPRYYEFKDCALKFSDTHMLCETIIKRRLRFLNLLFLDKDKFERKNAELGKVGNNTRERDVDLLRDDRMIRSFRKIPLISRDSTSYEQGEVSIPYTNNLVVTDDKDFNFFHEIAERAPSLLRITLSKLRVETQLNAETCASFLINRVSRSTLPVCLQEVAYNSLLKYFGYNQLVYCNISAGAGSASASMQVAQSFISCLGDYQDFDTDSCLSEPRNTSDLLATDHVAICSIIPELLTNAKHNISKAQKEEIFELFLKHEINPYPLTRHAFNIDYVHDLIYRMPHIWTLDEALNAVRLPYGSSDLLYSLQIKPVPPFSPNVYSPVGVNTDTNKGGRDLSDAQRFRVGLILDQSHPDSTDLTTSKWTTLNITSLSKHALIAGQTGSGKTRWTMHLCRELHRLGIPFTVVEPVKSEYAQQLKTFSPDIFTFRFDIHAASEVDQYSHYFVINPMMVPLGSTPARHIGYLKSCFEAAFPLGAVPSLILENGLQKYYTKVLEKIFSGVGIDNTDILYKPLSADLIKVIDNQVYPSFSDFVNYFNDDYITKETDGSKSDWSQEIKAMFRRRFTSLNDGPIGKAFREADSITVKHTKGKSRSKFTDMFPYLLGFTSEGRSVNSIIELDGLVDDDQKALLMAFLLSFLYEHRQAEKACSLKKGLNDDGKLKHVIIIEEAHRLLSNINSADSRGADFAGESPKAKAVSMFTNMLAEIRAYGQGIVIVEQSPSKLASDALKNTNLKIMLRLASAHDRAYMGQAMGLNEEQLEFAQTLRAKEGEYIHGIIHSDDMDEAQYAVLPLPSRTATQDDILYKILNEG